MLLKRLFDLNRDGKLDAWELAFANMALHALVEGEEDPTEDLELEEEDSG